MSSSSTKSLYAEQKSKLADRVLLNVSTFGQIANSVGEGGKADQVLKQSIDKFIATENTIQESAEGLRKLELLNIHMNYQFEGIRRNVGLLENLKEQAQSMRR